MEHPLVPLPWERLLWSGRPAWRHLTPAGSVRFVLTDFRIVRIDGSRVAEIALHDVGDIHRTQSRLDRLIGTSTLVVQSATGEPLALDGVRRGAQLAAVLELVSGDRRVALDVGQVNAALAWDPPAPGHEYRPALAAVALVCAGIFGVAIGLHGKTAPARYSPDDPIYPSGQKRSRAEIVRFMESDVMPWARVTLGRIKGGPDRITCETCHGGNAEARDWQMPAVAALPEPDIRESGWEHWGGVMDAQMRNAIYGYRAESQNQTRAGYMREIVMPGMARLLNRPAYDFTQPYEYNRSRSALGCYHCHRVY